MLAKEIMRRQVVTVSPDMALRELSQLFIDRQISGAPVVDGQGKLSGVISQTDLIRRDREKAADAAIPSFYQNEKAIYSSGYQIEDPDFTRVKDIMTPAGLCADETTPVEKLAQCMLRRHIHRIIITKGGKLSGIVTSMDMLRAFMALSRGAAAS